MVKTGYDNPKRQKKSLQDDFKDFIDIAHRNHNIKRPVKGLTNKFTRIKVEYAVFVAKIGTSGSILAAHICSIHLHSTPKCRNWTKESSTKPTP